MAGPAPFVNRLARSRVPLPMRASRLLRRAVIVATRAVFDLVLPLSVAFALVWFLADPDRISSSELRANSLLMGARPIFRVIAPGDELRVALGSSAILLGAAMLWAIALSVPAAVVYSWSKNRVIKG